MTSSFDPLLLDRALETASDEVGLQSYYRACVRPILSAPKERWPRCCGGGCEPCNAVLCRVAERTLQLLAEAGVSDSTGR